MRRLFNWLRCHNKAVCVTTAAVAVVGTIFMLSGCAPIEQKSATLRIVTTTTQVTDFTKNIAGTAARVDGLIQANQSAHEFDPSAKALVELANADVLVTNGLGLEPWLAQAIDASGFDGQVIVASKGITVVERDPHIWTAPKNALAMVKNITAGLIAADNKAAPTFKKNSAAYQKKLSQLSGWASANLGQIAQADRKLVTNHDGLSYFCRQYEITFIGSIIPSFDDNSESSAADIDRLIAAIKRTGTRAVFSETTISSKLAQTIASEAGVAIYSGDDALYADTLGATGTSGSTYLDATIHNVRVLVTAWTGSNLPLPEGLQS